MDALVMEPKTHHLSLVKTDIPTVTKPDDVIIKVAYAGVCGTDQHIIDGTFPCSKKPLILGHELTGTVCATGCDVKHVKKGDRVGVDPNSGCGICRYCHTASYHVCPHGALNSTLGIFSNGGWAQFCKVSSKQVYKLPSTISFKQAVLLEPLSCIYHGFSRIAPLHYSQNILITGAGIIGNLWCSVLHHMGHRNVTVSETEEVRRKLFKRLDSGYAITTPKELNKMFCNDSVNGVDIVIENSGNGTAIEQSLNLLNRGGKLCIFGVASPGTRVSMSPFDIFLREITIFGVTINRYSFQHAIGLMETMGSRYIDYCRLGVKVFSLSQCELALQELRKGSISKAVFKIDKCAE
ncbi:uncharacterized protein LOC142321656 [Lycorma delicatula]|uniref:uncharacterized protein LOC142321656 n=1 Tax=Lycorma delicatula TaxID=130591 RepID=UPI003F50EEC6